MFDPLRITTTDRRIQQRSQIIRSKGFYEIPNNVIDKRQMDKWARILTANHIPAFIPPTPSIFPIIIQSIVLMTPEQHEVQCNNDFLDNDFTLSEETQNLTIQNGHTLLKLSNNPSLLIYVNISGSPQQKQVEKGELYWVGPYYPHHISFKCYLKNEPENYFVLFAVQTVGDDETEVIFDQDTLIPGILRQ